MRDEKDDYGDRTQCRRTQQPVPALNGESDAPSERDSEEEEYRAQQGEPLTSQMAGSAFVRLATSGAETIALPPC